MGARRGSPPGPITTAPAPPARPAQPLEQAARSPGRHQQARDRAKRIRTTNDPVPGPKIRNHGAVQSRHEQVEAPEPGSQVATQLPTWTTRSSRNTSQITTPTTTPTQPPGLGNDHQRQDRGDDDRQLHPAVEARKKRTIAFRAGLTRPMLRCRGGIHGLRWCQIAWVYTPVDSTPSLDRHRGGTLIPPRHGAAPFYVAMNRRGLWRTCDWQRPGKRQVCCPLLEHEHVEVGRQSFLLLPEPASRRSSTEVRSSGILEIARA